MTALSILPSAARPEKGDMLVDVHTSKFQVGQSWKYGTRPGEEGSTLTVAKVESSAKTGVIVHISIRGVRVKNPRAPGGITTEANHIPMAESALQKSVTELVTAHAAVPAFEEGYREWRRAFDAGKAGAFTTPVADVVTFIEKAINRPSDH